MKSISFRNLVLLTILMLWGRVREYGDGAAYQSGQDGKAGGRV